MSNGYKQYGASHLLRLHQIRRMRELGIPLSDIASVQDDQEQQQLALNQLDGDLRDRIEALQKARAEVSQLLEYSAPIDTASGFIDRGAVFEQLGHLGAGLLQSPDRYGLRVHRHRCEDVERRPRSDEH